MNSGYTESLQQSDDLLEDERSTPTPLIAPGEIILGELLGFNDVGEPQVIYPGADGNVLSAMSTVAITHEHKGRQLALLFTNGDFSKPVIIGLIYNPLLDILNNVEFVTEPQEINDDDSQVAEIADIADIAEKVSSNTAYIDGNRVVLEGKEEIVLKCGEASITLTKAGKILIRGTYLLNRSSGVNRIMGGSVQVN